MPLLCISQRCCYFLFQRRCRCRLYISPSGAAATFFASGAAAILYISPSGTAATFFASGAAATFSGTAADFFVLYATTVSGRCRHPSSASLTLATSCMNSLDPAARMRAHLPMLACVELGDACHAWPFALHHIPKAAFVGAALFDFRKSPAVRTHCHSVGGRSLSPGGGGDLRVLHRHRHRWSQPDRAGH